MEFVVVAVELTLVLLSGEGVPGAASRLAHAACAVSDARVMCVPLVMVAVLVFAACSCFFC